MNRSSKPCDVNCRKKLASRSGRWSLGGFPSWTIRTHWCDCIFARFTNGRGRCECGRSSTAAGSTCQCRAHLCCRGQCLCWTGLRKSGATEHFSGWLGLSCHLSMFREGRISRWPRHPGPCADTCRCRRGGTRWKRHTCSRRHRLDNAPFFGQWCLEGSGSSQVHRVSSNAASSAAGCRRSSLPWRSSRTESMRRLPLISGIRSNFGSMASLSS